VLQKVCEVGLAEHIEVELQPLGDFAKFVDGEFIELGV